MKLFALFFILLLLCSCIYAACRSVSCAEKQWNCNQVFTYCNDGTFTISLIPGAQPEPLYEEFGGIFVQFHGYSSFIIDNGITKIPDAAFLGFEITTLTIASSVQTIGNCAFCTCPIETITFKNSNGVLSSSSDYFEFTSNKVLLSKAENAITAYFGSSRDLTIPNSVKTISPYAFFRSKLETVTIGSSSGLSEIGPYAFAESKNLRSVTSQKALSSIGAVAFKGCSSLQSVSLDGIGSIGGSAFEDCTSLASLTIPNSVTTIGARAFAHCTSLESVTLPTGIDVIPEDCFAGCTKLSSVSIPDKVQAIDNWAFSACSSLTTVNFMSSQTLTRVGISAFEACDHLSTIIIPESVKTIDIRAFAGCDRLTTVSIPGKIEKINKQAFAGCSQLSNVDFHGNSDPSGCSGDSFRSSPNAKASVPEDYSGDTFCGIVVAQHTFAPVSSAVSTLPSVLLIVFLSSLVIFLA